MIAHPFLIILLLPVLIFILRFFSPKNDQFRVIFLLALSICLIGYISALALSIAVVASLICWGMMHILNKKKSRILLFLFLVIIMSPLFIYKIMSGVDSEGGFLLTIGLPTGLAFYSIHLATGLADTYKNKISPMPLHKHLLATTFFPNFTAGPIWSYSQAEEQLKSRVRPATSAAISQGITLLALGLAKLLLIASPLRSINDTLYLNLVQPELVDQGLSLIESLFMSWGVITQLYFDFSGYSDIAIGIALCLGFYLPVNFNSPFKSKSASEYINRWHISLLNILKRYIFSPLSIFLIRNLHSKISGKKRVFLSYAISVFAVFLLAGIWHAPNVAFIYSALLVSTIVLIIEVSRLKNKSLNVGKGSRFSQVTLLFLASCIAAFFQAGSINSGAYLLSGYYNFEIFKLFTSPSSSLIFPNVSLQSFIIGSGYTPIMALAILTMASIVALFFPNSMELSRYQGYTKDDSRRYLLPPLSLLRIVFVTAVLLFSIFHTNDYGQFFYEQF